MRKELLFPALASMAIRSVGQSITITPPDTTIFQGDSVQLTAVTDAIVLGWSPAEGLADPSSPSTMASPSVTTTYTASVAYRNEGENLIVNGDFEQGYVGFTSEYEKAGSDPYLGCGRFNVGPEPFLGNKRFYINVGDHTTGSGNVQYIDGHAGPTDLDVVYRTTVNVEAGKTYAFSAWIINIIANYVNPAQLRFFVDGDTLGTLSAPSQGKLVFNSDGEWRDHYNATHASRGGRYLSAGGAPPPHLSFPSNQDWIEFYSVWTASTTETVEISIKDDLVYPYGNDFALDDLSFSPLFTGNTKSAQVTITVESKGLEPTWVAGYIKDTDGDGYGDMISVEIAPGTADSADEATDCREFRYSWPTETNLVSAGAADTVISGNIISVTDPNITSSGEGSGRAILAFPSGSIEGAVADSVGPAITLAVLLEKRNLADPDTLAVTFTEPINSSLSDNHAWLNVNGIARVSTTAYDTGEDRWIFVFGSGTVAEDDSVNIVYNSGLTDQLGNRPHIDNVKVPVILLRTKFRVVSGSYYLDSNADGKMDSIAITLDKSIDRDELDLMEFGFSWLERNSLAETVLMSVEGEDFDISGDNASVIGWRVTSGYDLKTDLTHVDASVWGSAYLVQPDPQSGTIDTSSIDVGDGMAPVIVRADYISFGSESVSDSLAVYFTEEVQSTAGSHPFRFMVPAGRTYMIRLLPVELDSNRMGLSVTAFDDGVEPSIGDSIWINETGQIRDNVGNVQTNAWNIKREMTVYRVFALVSASCFDTDSEPDGLIDLIRVVTSSPPDEAVLRSAAEHLVLPAYRKFEDIEESDLTATSYGFDISVRQGAVAPFTGVSASDNLVLNERVFSGNEMIPAGSIPISDSLAPVIVEAVFYPAYITESNATKNIPDTLTVTFSEGVTVGGITERPFGYLDNTGARYSMDIVRTSTAGGVTHTFYVTDKDRYPGPGDSIYVFSEMPLSDDSGNEQDYSTKPVELEVKEYRHAFSVVAGPSPFDPADKSEETIEWKRKLWETYPISGSPDKDQILVLVRPFGHLAEGTTLSAKVSIFDAVGNSIVDAEDAENIESVDKPYALAYLWDLRNKKGRKVGAGAYLCIVGIEKEDAGGTRRDYDLVRILVGVKAR